MKFKTNTNQLAEYVRVPPPKGAPEAGRAAFIPGVGKVPDWEAGKVPDEEGGRAC